MKEQMQKNYLSNLIKNYLLDRKLLLFKGDQELCELRDWMNQDIADKMNLSLSDSSIYDIINNCNKCSGIVEKKNGLGNCKNGVMIILNSPGLINRVEKKLLKKDSLELLKKIIKAISLEFNECYITNLIKCETDDTLLKPSQMVVNCQNIILKEIDFFKPNIIIVMGELLPMQKIIKESKGISWHNIEHPITLIKNPELKKRAWNTLKIVIEKFNGRKI